ncbi:MAG: type II toxin-antitoxin system prevent-host-death family antitoxin [Xanthomonadales bacterium]|nr:type II toxin-antitoxin system prevent-host-death family antitoxin [Xanthomonadales bacterium]
MEAITASNFRSSLASFLDKVTNDHEPVMVTRGDKQKAAVVISKEDYESLQETLYLFSSRANAVRLFSAFSQIDSKEAIERELIDENRKTDVDP